MIPSSRMHVLRFPDWPLRAVLGEPPPHPPVALVRQNTVVASTASARALGVRVGQRRRLAQGRAPSLRMLPHDPAQEERAFVPVLRLIEQHAPGVLLLRPGMAALRSRGVSRFHGGEAEAADALLAVLAEEGYPEALIGVADGAFTAELAALRAEGESARRAIVPVGGSRVFLAPVPVAALGDEELASLLARLGVHTLGEFAALGEGAVRDRFGEHGARLHALAQGSDSRPVQPRPPDPELAGEVGFDAPLGQADQIAFAVRQTADAVMLALADASVVCTEVRIDLTDDDGRVNSRTWLHPTCFEAADLVDRVRWQLEALAADARDDDHDAAHAFRGIVGVRIAPTAVDDAAHHQPALFGQASDERLHHALSRVQTIVGHRGVVTAAVAGGRWLSDRQVLTPWGERSVAPRDPARPWPGSLPGPHPAEVFDPPRPIRVRAAGDAVIEVDERGALSAAPAFVEDAAVASWAGPWPMREHRWDAARSRSGHRFQLVDERQRAWLVVLSDEGWLAEGRYR
ncbi:DNA polymerase Y family protein [Microbacterium bovistercoris]|uniref:DNA polymerase Y family protein n=2 Tax=Microbacterium bovistercoris TaxID=2293570 RepID=A0A371NSI9_9MICO|nr:DNA polymerase Y family protein [Microbacterium bovistercoris]